MLLIFWIECECKNKYTSNILDVLEYVINEKNDK
jgi:hypothetical protein